MSKTKRKPSVDELRNLVHRATSLAMDACEVIDNEGILMDDDEESEDFKRLVANIREEAGLEPDPRTK